MKKLLVGMLALTAMAGAEAQVSSKGKTKVKAGDTKLKVSNTTVCRTSSDSLSYAIGMNIGQSLINSGVNDINVAMLAKALTDVMNKSKTTFTEEQANMTLQKKLEEYRAKKTASQKAEGQAYLAVNAKRAGVISLPDGLQYEILKAGDPNGIKPKETDTVVVNYVGTLIDGTEFDNSFKRGQPAEFALNRVIRGWTEIVQLMTKGAHWKVYIPSELAYGERPPGPPITPNAALVFDIILEDVKPATPPAAH